MSKVTTGMQSAKFGLWESLQKKQKQKIIPFSTNKRDGKKERRELWSKRHSRDTSNNSNWIQFKQANIYTHQGNLNTDWLFDDIQKL